VEAVAMAAGIVVAAIAVADRACWVAVVSIAVAAAVAGTLVHTLH